MACCRSCCPALCCYLVIGILLYYFGFSPIIFIIDIVSTIISYVPFISYPLGWAFSIMKFLYNWIPLYYIYCFIICALNVGYQIMQQANLRRTLWNVQNTKPHQIFFIVFLTLVLPFLVSLLLVNFYLVITLILPFQMACTSYLITRRHGPMEANTIRNFYLFILMVPLFYVPFGIYGKIFGSQQIKIITDL